MEKVAIVWKIFATLLVGVVVMGCASTGEEDDGAGYRDELKITSLPNGAEVVVLDKGGRELFKTTTPASIKSENGENIDGNGGFIEIRKPGYISQRIQYGREPGLAIRLDIEPGLIWGYDVLFDPHSIHITLQTEEEARKAEEDARKAEEERLAAQKAEEERLLKTENSPDDFKLIQNEKGKIEIEVYKGKRAVVAIPAKINGIDVVTIRDEAFRPFYTVMGHKYTSDRTSLTNIAIPNSITTIGVSAFENNELTSVTIPNSVTTINASTFANNKLTSVSIPANVTTIGTSAFRNNKLTSISIPNSITRIGEYAFRNNQLTNIVIPNGVTFIGDGAFLDNPLVSITIPNSVTTIEDSAFGYSETVSFGMFSITQSVDYTITNITIAANKNITTEMGFEESFVNFYNSQGKKAGTYVRKGQIWTQE